MIEKKGRVRRKERAHNFRDPGPRPSPILGRTTEASLALGCGWVGRTSMHCL